MFECEFPFEELPLIIGSNRITDVTGVALLAGEDGPHDYSCWVQAITFDARHAEKYTEETTVTIDARSDDEWDRLTFAKLKSLLEADQEKLDQHFHRERADGRRAA